MITLTAYKAVPEFAQGLVRDMRVRWALEEAGLPYAVHLIGLDEKGSSAYRALQPFSQVPAIEIDGVKLFESGAIVLHIAQRSDTLLPADPRGRARATTWTFAALNSIEPPIQNLAEIDLFYPGQEWTGPRRPMVVDAIQQRLSQLEDWLGDRDYLEDRFTAGDLLMTTVLRILRHTDIVSKRPKLKAYKDRCEARPAFKKALAAHMEPFGKSAAIA